MKIKRGTIRKVISIFSSFLILINSFIPYLLVAPVASQVRAQEETVTPSAAEVSTEEAPTVTPEITQAQTIETPTLTPVVEVTPTVEVTPIEEVTQTIEPTLTPVEATSVPSPPPVEITSVVTLTPTPTQTPTFQTKEGTVTTTLIETYSCRSDSLNGCLITDKSDYAPTDVAVISGHGFLPTTIYTIRVSSTDEPAVNFEKEISTDSDGSFTYSYQLDGNYRPNYLVELSDSSGQIVASVTFTDSRITVSATLNGLSTATVNPGNNVIVAVTATLSGGDDWRSTGYAAAIGGLGGFTCYETADHNSNGTYIESFTVVAPTNVGTYNVYLRISGSNSNCNSQAGDNYITLTGKLIVVADTTPPLCPAPTITSSSSGKYISGSVFYYSTLIATSGSFTVTEGASDPGSGIQNVVFPNTVSNGATDTSSPYSHTYNWISTSSFSNSAAITCHDTAGNSATTTLNVLRDNTYPTLTSVVLDDYTVKNGDTINITSNEDDTGSGIGYCHAFWSTNTNASLSGDTDLGDLGSDCDGSITVPAGAGTFYVKVKVGDNVGLYLNPRASSAVTVDNTAPTTSDNTGFGGQSYFQTKTFTLTPNDHGGSGIIDTKYCVADFPATCTPNTSGTSVTVTCPTGVASCPDKWIFYYSIDNAGNIGATSHSYSFTITNDLVSPTTTDNIDGNWHKNNVTVTLTCNDTGGGTCGNTYYTTDGSTPTTSSSTGTSFTLSANGQYTIKYFSVDNVGNTETVKTATNLVKIDKTIPSLHDKTTFSGWYNSDQTSTFNYEDSLSGIASGNPASCIISTNGGSQDCSVTPNVCDNAGNCNVSPQISNLVNIDKTIPTISAAVSAGTVGSNGWYTSNVTVHFTCSDTGSGVASCPADQILNTEGSSISSTAQTATDNAGNTSLSSNIVTVKIDKSGPTSSLVVTAGTTGSNGWYTSDVTIATSCFDSVSSPMAFYTSDQYQTTNTTGEVFNGQCENSAGLITHASPLTIKLDKTNPTGSITSPNSGDYIKGTITINATADDGTGSGVSKVEFYHSSIAPTYIGQATTAPYSVNWDTTGVVDGSHSIYIKVFDNAGNQSGYYSIPVTVDNNAPIVSSVDSDGQIYNLSTTTPHQIKVTFNEALANNPTIGINPTPIDYQSVNDCSDIDAKTFCFDYTIAADQEKTHTIHISGANDFADNTMAQDSSHTFIVDTKAPTITGDFYRQGVYDHYAKVGDVVRVDFVTSEDISIDSMSIAGHAIGSYQPQYENHFYIYYTMQASDTEGPLTYSLTGHDAAGNSTTATGGGVTFDKTEPTATISYSTTAPTNSDVTATITPSEAVTITNNSGLTTYTFTDNGSFTFEFRDAAGNTGSATAIVNNIDKTDPAVPTASPAGGDYYSDQTVTLTAEEGAEIRYTTDGTEPTKSTGTVYSGTILVSVDTVIKAITVDSAGNVSPVMTETYGIAPLISNEASASVTTDSVTITWTTDDLSTSRVVYDTVSHSLGSGTNYGYANSTVEDTSKVTSHSVTITGLVSGTTYYYRVISHGSPESIGDELSFKTTSTTTSTTTSSSDTGTVSGATTSTPVCNDTKPASAPFGLTAVAGLNSVTLTWNKASDPVSYYLVTYGTSSGSQAYGNPNVGGSGTTSYTVTGLSGGTTYFFKVRAGNGCAPGEYSNEASATPLGGYIEGVSPGFEAGVLGEATGSAGLNGEGPTPTTTVVNVGQVLGVGTVLKNKLFVFGLPIAFILLLIIFFLKKRKKEIS